MVNLRTEAKYRPCQIRIPGVCNRNQETVVLCHLNCKRLLGTGVSQKVPDIFGAWGCHACHEAVDGRRKTKYKEDELKIMHYEGCFRTQKILIDEGRI